MNKKINILLAEDQRVFSEGMQMLLETNLDYAFLGSYENGQHLLESPFLAVTDLVFMDINMPIMDGIETCRRLKKSNPSIKVVMLSMYGSQELMMESINAGADGYLLKNTTCKEINMAVDAMMDDRVYFASKLIHSTRERNDDNYKPKTKLASSVLTRREKQILSRICNQSPSTISVELGLNLKVVYVYLQNLCRKFNVSSERDLAHIAPTLVV